MKSIFIDMMKETTRGFTMILLAFPFLLFVAMVLGVLGRVLWDILVWSFNLW